MKNRKLRVGDNVWLREDLVEDIKYGNEFFVKGMIKGVVIAIKENNGYTCKWFGIFGDDWHYSYEMVDWVKTEKMWEEQRVVNKKKIVMPKIFDEWYNSVDGFNVFNQIHTLTDNFYNSSLDVNLHRLVKNNKEKCIRAILDGYEVEKEDMYIVKIPSQHFDEYSSELRITNDVLWYCVETDECEFHSEGYDKRENDYKWIKYLTEDDIERCDERYIAFAEKV